MKLNASSVLSDQPKVNEIYLNFILPLFPKDRTYSEKLLPEKEFPETPVSLKKFTAIEISNN